MNLNKTKKDLSPEIKKELNKSKFKVLTNENDFLVKNLKKAGWFIRSKIFLKNKILKKFFWVEIIISWMITQNILNLSNIKFLLKIQVNTPDTKHLKQILVRLHLSQLEMRLEILTKIPSFF